MSTPLRTSNYPSGYEDDQPVGTTPPPFALEDEAPARRQPGSRVLCQLDGHPDVELMITNRERLAYEKTAARHPEWPAPERSRSFVMTFVTFAAAKRAEHPAATTFDAWCEVLLDWDEAEAPADPTR